MSTSDGLVFSLGSTVGELTLNVALQVGDEPVAIIGPNGCGKSTLLLTILGIRTPARGRITLMDELLFDAEKDVDRPTEERRMAYLPQDFGLFPFMTALENVEFAMTCQRSPSTRRERRDSASACLDRFGIAHLSARKPHQLSGGERQRVALARAISTQPRALLLDEPTASLDVGARTEIRTLLADSIRALAIPVLLVTHDIGDIRALAGRIAVMESGRLVAHMSLAEAQATPPNAFAAQLLRPTSDAGPVGANASTA
jgi:molybdate transport system ATP-binding protein